MRFTVNGTDYLITDNQGRGFRITERGLYIHDNFVAFRALGEYQDELDRVAAEMEEAASQEYWAERGYL